MLKTRFNKFTAWLLALWMLAGLALPAALYGEALDDAVIVSADKEVLVMGFAEGDDPDNVTANLTLPLTGASGSGITWQSDTTDVITDDGTVTRPAAVGEDTAVTLTAVLRYGEAEASREFTVTVLKEQPEPVLDDSEEDEEAAGDEEEDTGEDAAEEDAEEDAGESETGKEEMEFEVYSRGAAPLGRTALTDADGPIAYWSFDESFAVHNGNAAYNLVPLKYPGIGEGGPVREQFMGRNAVKFDRDNMQYPRT